MLCPRCLNSISAFSTKCMYCTADHTILNLWFANFVGVLLAGIIILGIGWLIF